MGVQIVADPDQALGVAVERMIREGLDRVRPVHGRAPRAAVPGSFTRQRVGPPRTHSRGTMPARRARSSKAFEKSLAHTQGSTGYAVWSWIACTCCNALAMRPLSMVTFASPTIKNWMVFPSGKSNATRDR